MPHQFNTMDWEHLAATLRQWYTEDFVHEALIRLWGKIERDGMVEEPVTWCRHAIQYVLLEHRREGAQRQRKRNGWMPVSLEEPGADEDGVEYSEEWQELQVPAPQLRRVVAREHLERLARFPGRARQELMGG